MDRTPLYEQQRALGARFIAFSGWEMPVYYQSLLAEHQAVRQAAGLFDISHMGKLRVSGSEAGARLARLVPTDLTKLAAGQGLYTVLLTPQGGILDDIILYKHPANPAQETWTLIVNAATAAKDRDWLRWHLQDLDWQDLTASHLLLALQGPEAEARLQPFVRERLDLIGRFGHAQFGLADPGASAAFVARTGYTGEDGFEILLEREAGAWLWQQLVGGGVQPCGLGCRDTLRLEAAMHLYGQDMDEQTTPLEAGLGWLVNSGADYLGRAALEQQRAAGCARRLVGLMMQGREIPRQGHPLWHAGKMVGVVTSGTRSPTLGQSIALGYVPAALATPGSCLEVEIRGKLQPAKVVKRPFYRRLA